MKLNNLGSNKTEIVANGKTIFFSYNTPVAAIIDGKEYKTSQKFSVTTTKHVNSFVSKNAELKEQSFFDNLVKWRLFVSDYYVKTILETSDDSGICLNGGVSDWKINAPALNRIKAWLKANTKGE